MINIHSALRTLCFIVCATTCFIVKAQTDDTGCGSGGIALADAYIRANPMYAYFVGQLEPYVSENKEHFREGADSISCADALSKAFFSSTVQVYDPNDIQRKAELDAKLGAIGIGRAPDEPSFSSILYGISMQLSRLARVLPPAAGGDYKPLHTPNNEWEQLQIFAGDMLHSLLQDPSVAAAIDSVEPLVREGANLEHQIIQDAAARLAQEE